MYTITAEADGFPVSVGQECASPIRNFHSVEWKGPVATERALERFEFEISFPKPV